MGGISEKWLELPYLLQQKNTDARCFRKNGINHYGNKNSINVDFEDGCIRKYTVTSASIHESQMLPALLDPTNDSDFARGDSLYSVFHFSEFLKSAGFHSRFHGKGRPIAPYLMRPRQEIA